MTSSWWSINEEAYSAFSSLEDSEKEPFLALKCGIESVRDNERALCVFELIFHLIEFNSTQQFSYNQSKVIMDVYSSIFDAYIVDTSSDKESTQAIQEFSTAIKSSQLFDYDQSKSIAQYFATSLIRPWFAYKEVFLSLPTEYVDKRSLAIQTPYMLPSLVVCEGLDADSVGGGSQVSAMSAMNASQVTGGGGDIDGLEQSSRPGSVSNSLHNSQILDGEMDSGDAVEAE